MLLSERQAALNKTIHHVIEERVVAHGCLLPGAGLQKNSVPRCACGGLSWLAAGDGGNEQDAVAILERGRFAAEEADVFFVEIDVEELADLALVIAHVTGERRELRGQVVQSFGDCGCAAVYFWRTFGEASECCGDFDCDCHDLLQSFRCGIIASW